LHRIACNDLKNGATCELHPLSPGNGYFRVSFAATGPGDPPEVTLVAKGVELAKAEAVLASKGELLGIPIATFATIIMLSGYVLDSGCPKM
jgi:hypothetical protein